MSEKTTMAEDFAHVAHFLRDAVSNQNEVELRALLSNNVNLIIAGLGLASVKLSKLKEQSNG